MSRPHIRRLVKNNPNFSYFKPAGIQKKELEEINLTIDEFEAIRLKDYKKFEQSKCAKKMDISQPTFHRLILQARNKIASAVIEGKAIKIQGGNFKLR